MNYIENILGFITDNSKRLSTRAIIIILSFLAILFIDNVLGFSYYYNKQRQLGQLQSISILLKDTTLSPEIRTDLINLQNETLERKSIVDRTLLFIKHFSWSKSNSEELKTNNERSDLWLLISSSGFYILIFILMVPILLIVDKKTPFLKIIATIIMLFIIFGILSVFNYWLFDLLLPDKIFGSWNWNYFFNVVLQIGFSGLAVLLSKLYKKATNKNASASKITADSDL